MKRTILFRGKATISRNWIYGYYLCVGDRHFIQPYLNNMPFEVDPNTVGQFSGLKDMKGVDIFDGDIVIDPKLGRSVVQFFNASFTVGNTHFVIGTKRAAGMEVVGTIHDLRPL